MLCGAWNLPDEKWEKNSEEGSHCLLFTAVAPQPLMPSPALLIHASGHKNQGRKIPAGIKVLFAQVRNSDISPNFAPPRKMTPSVV